MHVYVHVCICKKRVRPAHGHGECTRNIQITKSSPPKRCNARCSTTRNQPCTRTKASGQPGSAHVLTCGDSSHSGSSASYLAISSKAYAAALRVSHTLLRSNGKVRAISEPRISRWSLYMCASCSAAEVRASLDAPEETMARRVSRRVFCLAERAPLEPPALARY